MTSKEKNNQTKEKYIASLDEKDKELYCAIVQIIKDEQKRKKIDPQEYVKISVSRFNGFLQEKEVYTSDGTIQKFLKKLEEKKIIDVKRKIAGRGANKYKIIHSESTLSPESTYLPPLKGWISLADPRYMRRNADITCEGLLKISPYLFKKNMLLCFVKGMIACV